MPSFGTASRQRLDTCHPKLRLIMNRVVEKSKDIYEALDADQPE